MVLILYILFVVIIAFFCIPITVHILKKREEAVNRHQQELQEKELQRIQEKQRLAAIKEKESKEQSIKEMDAIFRSMPGWDEWDISIHNYPGQIDRINRRSQVSVVAYDKTYAIAKTKGSSGAYYITCNKYCSCYDFKKRGLPCKHMYALASFLHDRIQLAVDCEKGYSLYGLTFALAGRFAGRTNDPKGIRAEINSRKGIWTDRISSEVTALVCGMNPSEQKIISAKSMRITIMDEETVMSIFSPPEIN